MRCFITDMFLVFLTGEFADFVGYLPYVDSIIALLILII